eukprot:4178642-Amphidinium_carterae.1
MIVRYQQNYSPGTGRWPRLRPQSGSPLCASLSFCHLFPLGSRPPLGWVSPRLHLGAVWICPMGASAGPARRHAQAGPLPLRSTYKL